MQRVRSGSHGAGAGAGVSNSLDDLMRRVERLEQSEKKSIDAHPDDERVDCDHCGQLLGLRCKRTDRIRMQIREFNVSFVLDPEQPAITHCKRCGHTNEIYRAK